MSDSEGSPQEQPGSPEEQEDLGTKSNDDEPEEEPEEESEEGNQKKNVDQKKRKRSLSTSEEKNDDAPSEKVAKEEISLAIICDTHAKALEKIKQTETAIVIHLKVKVTEDLSLDTIPSAVEEVLSEDPETEYVVIVLPQDDLHQESIPHSCKINSCSGKGLQHTLPLPVASLVTYMDTLKKTREELMDAYPDTEFYWVAPGPVDFCHLNRKKIEKKHGHSITSDDMWKAMIANYNKRLKVINEEIPGNKNIWFTRALQKNRHNNRYESDNSIQRVLQGDLEPVETAELIKEGENLTVKGGQAMYMLIRKKIILNRKSQAKERAKAETKKEEDASGNAATDDKSEVEVNGKAEEDAHTENNLNESQKKKLSGSTVKTTVIGDSWIQILADIERWHPDPRNRKNVKVYPDLTLDSVIEKVDEVLSEETNTKNLVLSVFQSDISSGLSAENVENEIIPCVYSTVDDLLEKASNISKYIKKTYPQVKLFWVTPGPVGYYSGEDKKEEEEKMEAESKEQEKKEEKKEEETEDKADDEADDEEKEENEEKKEETNEEKSVKEAEEVEEEEEEEEKEEDPEIRKLRKACISCNTIAMVLSKRLHFRFKKQVVDWLGVFNSNRSDLEGEILEGKVVKKGYLDDENFVNLSELGGNKLMELIITTIYGEKPRSRESDDHGPQGNNRRGGGMRGRMDSGRGRGRGRGSDRGRGRGGRNDGGMGRRPIDKRLSWEGRGGGQHDPWDQQGGGTWKGQHRRFQGQEMRDINRDRDANIRRDNWGGSNWGGSRQFVDPWARYNYSDYYGQRY